MLLGWKLETSLLTTSSLSDLCRPLQHPVPFLARADAALFLNGKSMWIHGSKLIRWQRSTLKRGLFFFFFFPSPSPSLPSPLLVSSFFSFPLHPFSLICCVFYKKRVFNMHIGTHSCTNPHNHALLNFYLPIFQLTLKSVQLSAHKELKMHVLFHTSDKRSLVASF